MQGVVWERKRENGSCPVNKGGSAEVKVVRGGLRWVTYLSVGAMVFICPGWVPRPLGIWPCCNRSLLIPWTPDTSIDREDRAVQSWPHLSLAAILGRTGSIPNWLQDLKSNRADPVFGGVNELALRA